MRADKARHVANGVCSNGDGRVLQTKVYCVECSDRLKRDRKEAAIQYEMFGLCRNGCGRPLKTKTYCAECLERTKQWKALRAERLDQMALEATHAS